MIATKFFIKNTTITQFKFILGYKIIILTVKFIRYDTIEILKNVIIMIEN